MARLLLTAVWALLALVAPAAEPYVPQQAVDLFDGREVSAPEGVWRVTDGAVFAVVRTGDAVDRYDLVMVSSPDLRLPGFTRVGWMKALPALSMKRKCTPTSTPPDGSAESIVTRCVSARRLERKCWESVL